MVLAVALIINSRLSLNSIEITMTFCSKVTKMGSIVGHRIDYIKWGRGSERPVAHTQQNLTQIPLPPPFSAGMGHLFHVAS